MIRELKILCGKCNIASLAYIWFIHKFIIQYINNGIIYSLMYFLYESRMRMRTLGFLFYLYSCIIIMLLGLTDHKINSKIFKFAYSLLDCWYSWVKSIKFKRFKIQFSRLSLTLTTADEHSTYSIAYEFHIKTLLT